MQPRLDFYKASPDAAKAMLALEAAVKSPGLETEPARTCEAARVADQRLRLLMPRLRIWWKDEPAADENR